MSAEFYDLGALWKPKPGQKSKASGMVKYEDMKKLMDAWPRGQESVRIFIADANGRSARAPDYRLSAVIDDEDEKDRGRRDSGRRDEQPSKGRARDDDRGRDRDRDDNRSSSRGDDRDKEPFKATDDDVPF